jgi:uncharacterized protein YpmB
MKKSIIIFFIIFAIIIFIAIAFFLKKYDFTVEYKEEPIKKALPIVSFMIMNNMSDDKIKEKILEDPLFLHEECKDCQFVDMRTPFITAVAFKRTELIKYMIEKGVSVEKNIKIIEAEGPKEYLEFLNDILEKKEAANN